jgi:hypothetical protein
VALGRGARAADVGAMSRPAYFARLGIRDYNEH